MFTSIFLFSKQCLTACACYRPCLSCMCKTESRSEQDCVFELTGCARFESFADFNSNSQTFSCMAANNGLTGYSSKSALENNSTVACLKATYDLMSRATACPVAGYAPPCLSVYLSVHIRLFVDLLISLFIQYIYIYCFEFLICCLSFTNSFFKFFSACVSRMSQR
jgi:hypothetical protein